RRDAAPPGRVGQVRSAGAVGGHPFDPALGWRKNFRQGRGALQEPEEVRRGAAGEQRSVTAGFNRRHVTRQDARRLVADPENTAMNADQGSTSHTSLNRGPRQPGTRKLLACDDTVRARCEVGKNLVDCPVLRSYSEH
ncbi:MAG TPA: hypothetical protein VKA89_09095, partial [Solirubrobacterales bacterium]|nr:hypothetical protein [Solirubrobacterales bacterium]